MDTVDFILLILIFVGIGYAYVTLTSSSSKPQKSNKMDQQKIQAVREAMKTSSVTLSDASKTRLQNYVSSSVDVDREFPNWDSDIAKLQNMCEEGWKFLQFYQLKKDLTALKIADAYVTKLLTKLEKIPGEIIETNPWSNWYQPSIYLTRFLANYVYIGAKQDLIDRCKCQLLRLVPEVGICMKKTHSGVDLLKIAIPRLCVTFLNPPVFKWDVSTDKFQELKILMNLQHIESDDVQDGYYDDGSVIINGLASYERFLELHGYYEEVYRSMGLETNLKKLAEHIFPKITHPDVPRYPVGLFRSSGNRSVAKLWDWTSSKNEISLIPFIGLGVFKCESFVFFVRVQRPDVHACFTLDPNIAAGWIQIRRIFLVGKQYPSIVDKSNFKDEPGVLSIADGSGKLAAKKNYDCYDVNSLIGCLEGLMFWKNSYKFPELYGDVTISEVGVVTTDGLQAHYKIVNNSGKALKFRYKDSLSNFAINEVNVRSSGDFIDVSEGTSDFIWTMAKKSINFGVELTEKGLKFETSDEKYDIQVIGEPNKHYVVKFGTKTILGSSSSRLLEIFYNGKKYRRNLETMMYEIYD